jgi:N-acetylmuramoyl-L-alanine amidase
MRPYRITVHCSATKEDQDIGAKEIREWHTDPYHKGGDRWRWKGQTYESILHLPQFIRSRRGNGWSDIGYHAVIRRDGRIEYGRPPGSMGAHVAGENAGNLGICLVGGITDGGKPKNNFTVEQFASLRWLIIEWIGVYGIQDTQIRGHCDFEGVLKACPCFDVRQWWESVTGGD